MIFTFRNAKNHLERTYRNEASHAQGYFAVTTVVNHRTRKAKVAYVFEMNHAGRLLALNDGEVEIQLPRTVSIGTIRDLNKATLARAFIRDGEVRILTNPHSTSPPLRRKSCVLFCGTVIADDGSVVKNADMTDYRFSVDGEKRHKLIVTGHDDELQQCGGGQ